MPSSLEASWNQRREHKEQLDQLSVQIKLGGLQNAPTCLQKKVYTVGLQPVLWVEFNLLLIAYKSYTQCTKSRIRGI